MSAATRRLIAGTVVLAVAGLAGQSAGSIREASPPLQVSDNVQMRYYGGPKSPMWAAPPTSEPASKSGQAVKRSRGHVAGCGLFGCERS
jgi:hypothetical protein